MSSGFSTSVLAWTLFLLGVLSLAAIAGAAPEPIDEPTPSPTAPEASPGGSLARTQGGVPANVLLITVDTLRMDHLGAYGYPLATSPAIDRLAREGVLFTDVMTPTPMTAPALASLLTGHHLERHRVSDNVGTFPADLPSLARTLVAAGYDTAGFYGNEAIEDFGHHFGVWEEFPRKIARRGRVLDDTLGTTRALEWLEQASEPWFLWLHFIDPHGPYDSSPPKRSAGFTYDEKPAWQREIEVSEKNWVFGAVPRYQRLPGASRVVDYLRRYDGEIVGTDLQVARLYDWLEKRGELEQTLIVLTADHGESLTEDNYFFQHGKVLNEASLRVPLILRHPSLPVGARVGAPSSLVDLYPTLVGLLGLPAPDGTAGRDLSGAIFGDVPPQRIRISYTVTPDLQVAVQRGHFRLRGKPAKKDGGARIDRLIGLRLFDTRTRPATPLRREDHPEIVKELRSDLTRASIHLRTFESTGIQPTAHQIERLRALGYLD